MWQRSSLLLGAEVSLLDADAPGSLPGRRGRSGAAASDAPCATCPGARAGPGGAPAFPRDGRGEGLPAEGTAAGGRGRGRGATARTLKLSREPALGALARDSAELGKRAAGVLARVEWPGKPGVAAPAAPLTAEEQQRFNEGRDIYNNLCVACHQPDGRGREKLAPSILGSEFALGPPSVPVRVLMNGKEGAVGLMPPLGAGLTDQQIAAVLTYIRREWGQAGSPVDSALVAQIRPLTAGRTRPWTDDDLAKIAAASK